MPTYSGALPSSGGPDPQNVRMQYLLAMMRGDRPFLPETDQKLIGLTEYGNEQPFARDDYQHPSLLGVGPKGSGLQALIDTPERYDKGYSYGTFNNEDNARAFSDALFRMMRLHYERGQHQAQGANRAGLLPSGMAWDAMNPPPTQDQLPPLPRDIHGNPIGGMLMGNVDRAARARVTLPRPKGRGSKRYI